MTGIQFLWRFFEQAKTFYLILYYAIFNPLKNYF